MSYFKHKNLLANMFCGRNIYLLYSVFGLFELFVTTLKLMPFSCNKLRDSVCSPTYVGDASFKLSGCSGPMLVSWTNVMQVYICVLCLCCVSNVDIQTCDQVCADLLQVLPLLPGKVPQVSQLQCLYYLLHEGSYFSQEFFKFRAFLQMFLCFNGQQMLKVESWKLTT